ncbi:MAG TPA: hypothetical protein VF996_02840 [Candidatus Saccharimonadales bacterium]
MSKIRGKDTKVEKLVFSYLRRNGIYFQKHYRGKDNVRIDIALPREKRAIFVDGDFWHGRDYEGRKDKLKQFWRDKIARNIERDKEQFKILVDNGWSVLRVWEKELMRKRTQQKETG